jgi:hypothetical protein
MQWKKNAYKIVGKPQRKTVLQKCRPRRQVNVYMKLVGRGSENLNWIHLSRERILWQVTEKGLLLHLDDGDKFF